MQAKTKQTKMSNSEKNFSNWSAKVDQIMNSIDLKKTRITSPDEMTPITSYSLGVNLIPYHEFSSTVRPEVRQEILEYMEAELEKYEQSRKKKSSEEADRLRAEGNTHYQRKNFDAALHSYTMSILYAPVQSEGGDEADKKSSSLALGYGNRSATFFEIGQWASVLADIEHALEAGHQGVGKLLLRKADALINLRKFEMAKVVLKDSRLKQDPSLEGTVIGRLVTVERSLRAAKAQQSPLNEINIPPSEFPPLSEIISSLSTFSDHPYEPSEQIPSLSRKLEVRSSKEKGRHLVATEPISPGEILAVELPYASVLVKKEELSYCHHCCRRLKTDQFAVLPEEHNLGDKLGNAQRMEGQFQCLPPSFSIINSILPFLSPLQLTRQVAVREGGSALHRLHRPALLLGRLSAGGLDVVPPVRVLHPPNALQPRSGPPCPANALHA